MRGFEHILAGVCGTHGEFDASHVSSVQATYFQQSGPPIAVQFGIRDRFGALRGMDELVITRIDAGMRHFLAVYSEEEDIAGLCRHQRDIAAAIGLLLTGTWHLDALFPVGVVDQTAAIETLARRSAAKSVGRAEHSLCPRYDLLTDRDAGGTLSVGCPRPDRCTLVGRFDWRGGAAGQHEDEDEDEDEDEYDGVQPGAASPGQSEQGGGRFHLSIV